MTRDIGILNKKCVTKKLGMAKLYEKGKHFLEEEVRRSGACLFIRFQQRQAQHSIISTKIWTVFQIRDVTVENKVQSTKKLGFPTNKPTSEKISPNTRNLSKYNLIKFQIFVT